MKRRLAALTMAGVLAVTMLAGCGGTSKKDTSKGDKTEAQESKSEPSEDIKTSNDAQEDSNSGETPVVKWYVFGDKMPDHDMVMDDLNNKIKEKINVELDLQVIPQGEFADKMKLASTAGEDFDLVFTSNWLNSFDENMSREAFMPIDELFEKYGQGIKESMPDWLLDIGKVDGKLYAVPNQQIIARQLGVVIQKEYADKYGFNNTSMKDITELEPFLDEIVKNEPGMFPIDTRANAYIENKYEDLVSVAHYACAYIDKNDPDAKLIPATTAMEDQLKLDNDWYKKGYIRKDIATVTDNTADVKANRYVCSLSSYKPGIDAEFSSRQGVPYIAVPIEGSYVKSISGIETMTAVNVNSKNPEAAMKLLNLVYTDKEIFNELLFGLEGTHYEKTGENSAQPVTDSKYNYSAYGWKMGNQFNEWYLPGQEEGLWEATDKLNREAQVSVLRGFMFNPANVQAEIAQIAAVDKEYYNGQYTAEDIDKYISERNEKLEQAGLNKVIEELQNQIDTWKGQSK